jgi:hypothetical protein
MTSLKGAGNIMKDDCYVGGGSERGAGACADYCKRQIQPSERVVHWNTRRWDGCLDFLHRSSKISRCKIRGVDVGAVMLKGGPHTILGSAGGGLACLAPLPPKNTTSIDYTTTVCVQGVDPLLYTHTYYTDILYKNINWMKLNHSWQTNSHSAN